MIDMTAAIASLLTLTSSLVQTNELQTVKLAQSQQTMASCVKELNDAYPYRVSSERHFIHVDSCQATLSIIGMGESIGSCVSNLNDVYPYRVSSSTNDKHRQICSVLIQSQHNNQQQNTNNSLPYPYPYPAHKSGGNPQAISDCMKHLMYERKAACTRRSCARLGSPEENANSRFGGWQWQTVRTSMSESTAAQACQNAR